MGQTNQIQGSRFRYVLLILIALIWGSQFLLNDLALEVFTPQAVSWLRATIGFLTLSGFLLILPEAHDNPVSKISYWRQIIMIGFFEATLPFFLVAWGQQHVNSAIAAILMSLVAIFTLILVVVFVRSEPVTRLLVLPLVLQVLLCCYGLRLASLNKATAYLEVQQF